MFKRTKLSLAAVCVVSGMAMLTQSASAQDAPQRVEITGSSIKRISAETAAPVQVIGREEIKATGANTVRQLLDTVTATTSNEVSVRRTHIDSP